MKKVDVLLSVYDPNTEYLVKQLKSLDEQTYENIEILIFDDCIQKRFDTSLVAESIQKKQYRILPYKEENLGYTRAFEYLTMESTGEYVAFCDQDDLWAKDKIEKCVACLEKDHTSLVITDRKLIDKDDQVTCESVWNENPGKKWNTHEDVGKYNFFTTIAPGMCQVMKGDFIRSAVPFSNETGHDKWSIACACACDGVSFLDEPLSLYRRHGDNVSGVLVRIHSKKDYMERRVMVHLRVIEQIREKYPQYAGTEEALELAYARKNHNLLKMYKYRYLAPGIIKAEILLTFIPDFMLKLLMKIIQK